MAVPFNDQEIMRSIEALDQQAFAALYDEYGAAVFSLAYRVLQNATLAEEVAQDTFLKVWQHVSTWDPAKGKLKNWLLSITHFTAIDRLRRERRQPALHPESLDVMEDYLMSNRADDMWQDNTAIAAMMKQLTAEQSRLIELAFFKGMSHGDIAEATRIPLGTVKTRLRTGLQRLRKLWLEMERQQS